VVLDNLLNPIFSPLLNLPTLWSVILLSFIISLVITLVYKYTTDQNLMKQLKEEMKASQKQVKELRSHPEEAMKAQKKAMRTNMKYMMQSMKSTLYSFIPIILIFGWMNANLAFVPILPGQEFETSINFEKNIGGQAEISVPEGINVIGGIKKEIKDGRVTWFLDGKRGEYLLEYIVDGKKYNKEVIITENEYKEPIKRIKDGTVNTIEVKHDKNILFNLFGWKIGWLITYIIFAIIFSIVIRKIIKVY